MTPKQPQPVDWQAILDDHVGVCPHCWAPHSEAWYTCEFVRGYYTCGACSRRYTMQEFPTKAQIEALHAEVVRIGPEHYKDFDPEDDTRGISGTVLRGIVRDSGWTWPEDRDRSQHLAHKQGGVS